MTHLTGWDLPSLHTVLASSLLLLRVAFIPLCLAVILRAEIEVRGLEEEGFALGFYRAKVVHVGPNHVVVDDVDLLEDDGVTPNRETIPLDTAHPRVRPMPP